MTELFSEATIHALARQFKEPDWITQLRQQALTQHAHLPWPHPSDDIWRRTDVTLLDPAKGFAPRQPSLLQSVRLSDAQVAQYMQPLGDERLIVRANGAWLTEDRPRDLLIEDLARASTNDGRLLRRAIEANGLSEAEQKLATLNTAFHHDDVAIQVPAGCVANQTLRMVRLFSVTGQEAIFPLTVITVGAGSRATLIDEYVSLPADEGEQPHLINARIELVLESGAQLHFVRLQRWGAQAREFLLQRATLADGATLTMANINLGAALSKAHIVTKLTGPNASTKLSGFVFGHHAQHIDQHTLQDHQAPHTTSDLAFRAALQDQSRMIYTGLIRIAKSAKQTSAYQANHNLLLSQGAKAETIPMLEILADDVQCKHGASTGPIDEEQTFYLTSRGLPRAAAQRLLVMGFIEPVMQQIPFAPLQEQLRLEIEGELHA